jgi:hypothetical protein
MPEKSETIQKFFYKKNSSPYKHEIMLHEFPPVGDFSIVNRFQPRMTVYYFSCHPGFNVMFDMGSLLHLLAYVTVSGTNFTVCRKEMPGTASPSDYLFILYIRIGKEKLTDCLSILPSAITNNRGEQ